MQQPAAQELPEAVTVETLRQTQAYIQEISAPLANVRMQVADAALIADEYANATRLLLHACERGMAIRQGRLGEPEVKNRLAAKMRTIIGEHRRLWLARNREGG